MESYNEMKRKEVESTKNFTIREFRLNIMIYSVFRFLFSDLFTFLFIFIPLGFVAYYYDFRTPVVIAMLILHPFLFYGLNNPLNKLTGMDEHIKELDLLIEINKEILKEKKQKVQSHKNFDQS